MTDDEFEQDDFMIKREVLSVSRLNLEVRTLLEGSFPANVDRR